MTFAELKNKIIEDETEFTIEIYEDVGADQTEIDKVIGDITSEINSYQTPSELIWFFVARGYNESDAANTLFDYLIEK
jgi:hypothetical protein